MGSLAEPVLQACVVPASDAQAAAEARVVAMRGAWSMPQRSNSSWSGLGWCRSRGGRPDYRALVRHGLVQARKRRRQREVYRRWERPRAMDLWQMDVMGRGFFADGAEVRIRDRDR